MPEYYLFFKKLLLGTEFIAALAGVFYIFKEKKSYWSLFSIYLIIIFFQEFFWYNKVNFYFLKKEEYYTFIGIPLQYLFLYWLYAFKSLKRKGMFFLLATIYLLTYIPFGFFLKQLNVVYSINLTIGTILLTILIVLEFLKQINNDDILKFKENKMFYINVGVILTYVGTYPFFAFYDFFSKSENASVWNIYFFYFLIANCIMYLLFTASFIWGKHQS